MRTKKTKKPAVNKEPNHEWQDGDVFSILDVPFNTVKYRLLEKSPHTSKTLLSSINFIVYEVDETGKRLYDQVMTTGRTIDEIMRLYKNFPTSFKLIGYVCNINKPEVKRKWKVGDVFSIKDIDTGRIRYRVIGVIPEGKLCGRFASFEANEQGEKIYHFQCHSTDTIDDLVKFYETATSYKLHEYVCNVIEKKKKKFEFSPVNEYVDQITYRKQKGIVVGFFKVVEGGLHSVVGWSLCHKSDKFDYELGLGLARANAMGWKVSEHSRTLPHSLVKSFNKMTKRMERIKRQMVS